MSNRNGVTLPGIAVVALLCACKQPADEPAGEPTGEATAPLEQEGQQAGQKLRAVARLEAKSESSLSGEAFFTEEDSGDVSFAVHIENVEPGQHAVHIHESGDCSAPDASSAGDHWNPTSDPHGKWGEEPHHLGDIGNIEVGEDGSGSLSLTTEDWSLGEMDARSVLGKAVVVHAGEDDFSTQPDGAAGDRIGCGVITLTQETPEGTT
jgi:Cu-Zn family superoxide dismutase